MSNQQQTLHTYLELVNRYPSPHNGQPIRLKPLAEGRFEVYFERSRGLQLSEISYIFSFVSMGVFMRHLALCAEALGHSLDYELSLPKVTELRGEGPVRFAMATLQWDVGTADEALHKALQFRQTSRKKYHQGVTDEVAAAVVELAAKVHMKLTRLSAPQAKQAVWLNQRAVFDDMFDEPVRLELDHWLRYSQAEKQAKRDGLSYDCMELNGRSMKWIVAHPKILRAPGISWLLKQYYLRTMTDSSDVFYMLAPFRTERQSFDVGLTIMDMWTQISAQGYYLHPFGTIMSNQAAHRDFLELAGVHDESLAENYLVFIFRAGTSAPPVPSLRLDYTQHLLMEES
ncbi:MAG: hypothetical protein JWN38_512 [Candidatus Saccharibacteria bacterium]|nr:hypothetical protein [Candidatus Saccharibacteria bacterium]